MCVFVCISNPSIGSGTLQAYDSLRAGPAFAGRTGAAPRPSGGSAALRRRRAFRACAACHVRPRSRVWTSVTAPKRHRDLCRRLPTSRPQPRSDPSIGLGLHRRYGCRPAARENCQPAGTAALNAVRGPMAALPAAAPWFVTWHPQGGFNCRTGYISTCSPSITRVPTQSMPSAPAVRSECNSIKRWPNVHVLIAVNCQFLTFTGAGCLPFVPGANLASGWARSPTSTAARMAGESTSGSDQPPPRPRSSAPSAMQIVKSLIAGGVAGGL